MVFHVRCVPKCSEDKKNPNLMRGLIELYLRGGLLGMHPKSHIGSE